MLRPANLKDVAKAAKLSVATVSRMLNGSLDLPEETRKRIEDAIAALNYKPNPHARRLSRGQSDTLGLVVPDIANPFFAAIVAGVEQEADKRGLAVSLFATLNRPGRELVYLDLLQHRHLDGLIFFTNHTDDGSLATTINRVGKVVVVDEDVPGAEVPKLFCDNEKGGFLVGNHLAAAGHSDVMFVGSSPAMISGRRRLDGLRRAMAEHWGDGARVRTQFGSYSVEFGREAASRFIEEGLPSTAVFASSDEIAIGMIEVFQSEGISIPDDVSLIGFDDVAPFHLFAPPITTVRQPVAELGRRALELLLNTNWDDPSSMIEEIVPVELVARESVGSPPDR